MIPISLYVIIEMLKLTQAYLINNDIEMYSHENESWSRCRNSDLIEELGQVEFMFSDKTGTLTKNQMDLKKCSVNREIYGDLVGDEEVQEGLCKSSVDTIFKQMMGSDSNKQTRSVRNFLTALSVCHTVVCDRDKVNPDIINYQSSSPDELALVIGAKQMGYELKYRSTDSVGVFNQHEGYIEEYKVLAEFPFSSDRKRMSMIIKDDDTYFLFCKGADAVMMQRINFEYEGDDDFEKQVDKDLHKFATDGLRVLVIAVRQLTEDEFLKFQIKYDEVRSSKSKEKDDMLDRLYDKYEQNLKYIGVSAIEDKLQDGVPETIANLREAGINVWMLTGDKMETAIEIARSCALFDQGMTELLFSFKEIDQVVQKLESELKYLELKDLVSNS